MTDVFFSYKRENEDRVVKLVRGLEEAAHSLANPSKTFPLRRL